MRVGAEWGWGVGGCGFSILTCTNHPDFANTIAGNVCLDLRRKAIPQYSCQVLGSQTCSKHNTINGSGQRLELTLFWEAAPTNTAWLECRRPPLRPGCYILQKNKTLNLGNLSTNSQISLCFQPWMKTHNSSVVQDKRGPTHIRTST